MVAETGLYDSLGVSSSATPDEIRKAYRKMALKHHPDKNKDDPKAEGKFKEVGQAYEILSDPEKRKTYDQYGLDFILRGGPAPDAGGAGSGGFPQGASGMPGGFGGFGGGGPGAQSFHFGAGGGGPGGFQFTNANDIFSQFFSSGAAGGMGMGMDDDDPMAGLGGMGGFGGAGRGGRTRMGGGGPSRRQNEITVVERQLPVSLADLFTGTTKKLKLNRKLYDEATGKTTTQEKILTLPIKKGMKHGSKFKFSNAGDQAEGSTQDIHVILQEKPDEKFTRTDDDLRMDVELELKEALTGWKRTVTTIDGRQLSVSSGGPTQPTWVERFPGLGMPKSKKPDARGDFIVGVKINFPRSLTADQKAKLKEILP